MPVGDRVAVALLCTTLLVSATSHADVSNVVRLAAVPDVQRRVEPHVRAAGFELEGANGRDWAQLPPQQWARSRGCGGVRAAAAVTEGEQGLRVEVVDCATGQVTRRTVALEGTDPVLARSAALETAGLILGATLESLTASPSATDASPTSESAPPAPTPSTTPTASSEPAERLPLVSSPSSGALLVGAGYQLYYDAAASRHGPSLSLTSDGRLVSFRLWADWLRSATLRVESTDASAQLRFRVTEGAFGFALGGRVPLGTSFSLRGWLGPSLVWLQRTTLSARGSSPTADSDLWAARATARVAAQWQPLYPEALWVELGVDLSAWLRRPQWRLEDVGSGDLEGSRSWSVLQPGGYVGLGWRFD